MSATQARHPAGTLTGGQFVSTFRPEPRYALEPDPPADSAAPASAVSAGQPGSGTVTVDGRPVDPEIVVLSDEHRAERYYGTADSTTRTTGSQRWCGPGRTGRSSARCTTATTGARTLLTGARLSSGTGVAGPSTASSTTGATSCTTLLTGAQRWSGSGMTGPPRAPSIGGKERRWTD